MNDKKKLKTPIVIDPNSFKSTSNNTKRSSNKNKKINDILANKNKDILRIERKLKEEELRIRKMRKLKNQNDLKEKVDVCIIISSYNRKEKLKRLIDQLNTQESKYTFKIILYNDGSKGYRIFKTIENLSYIEGTKNHGKFRYWKTITKLLQRAFNLYDFKYLIQMDDDFILDDNFIDKLVDKYKEIKKEDKKYIAIHYHIGQTIEEKQWGLDYWIDGGGFYDYKFLEKINFKIDEIQMHRWNHDKSLSSGVWHQISKKINDLGFKIYKPEISYASHDGNDDSKMNSELRKSFPIISKKDKKTYHKMNKKPEITAILNCYNRSYTLDKQIMALKRQTEPCNIMVWYNKGEKPQKDVTSKDIITVKSSHNFKFHGRFTLAHLAETPYVAVFDDDILPGRNWFKNCLDSMKQQEGIMGGTGVTLSWKGYKPNAGKHGWNSRRENKNIQRVDLVGHAWFFKKEWAKYMWYEEPPTRDNGEDIMFSYLAQKYGKINTFVPPHINEDKSLWSNTAGLDWGNDENASYKKKSHYHLRNQICEFAINGGWETVNNCK
jgi:GT2 family glycosyltransferase